MSDKKKRLTIGLLVSGITEDFVISICKGVIHAAKEADVNLVVLPGKYIERDLSQNKEIRYEYQYNSLFEYARPDTLDAVIVLADVIGCFTDKNKIKQFLEKFKDMPCVLVASKFPGYLSINSDNDQGIREVMEYIIRVKQCRRFGMIGGPEDNTDAKERKETFIRILQEYKLDFEPENYVVSDLSRRDQMAVTLFLNQNPDIEAVFCVNDDVAFNLYDEMTKRHLVPGKDILIFGYDNSTFASKVNPTLSSIWNNKNELGEKALQTIIGMLEGKEEHSQVLPGKFILRESIGGRRTHLNVMPEEYEELILSSVNSVFYRAQYEESVNLQKSRENFELLLRKLLFLLEDEDNPHQNYEDIIRCADEINLEYADIDKLLSIYEELCNYLCHNHKKPEKKYETRQVFELLYRKMIHVMNHQFGKIQSKQERDNYLFKLFVSNTMQFEKGDDQSYTKLISDIDFLGIRNAGIYLFEESVVCRSMEEFQCPDHVVLRAMLQDGQVQAVHRNVLVSSLFEFEKICGGRFSAVCLPLFSNEVMYGVLICNLTSRLFENGEFLVNQMGSAVKMIDLLKTTERISKSDPLTGILNRRGFYSELETTLERLRKNKKNVLFAYIDMNNLKIINNQFGHEEGDFSLKLIGRVLKKIVANVGIAGRIGGDEYACALVYEEKDNGEAFVKKVSQSFDEFNETSSKLYNITVSTGVYVTHPDKKISCEDALAYADECLYEAKKYKAQTVVKNKEKGRL